MSTAPLLSEGEGRRTHSPGADGRGSRRRPSVRRLLLGAGGTLVAAAGALVAVGCFLGLYVRPTSDDWCAAWKSRDLGVLGITSDFYTTQNGRIANAFLSGVIYGGGLGGVKILPTVMAVTFTLGLVLLGCRFVRLLGGKPQVLTLFACSLAIQALIYYAGTRSYQVLLWAPATISHTIPSVIGVWALLLGIWTVRQPRAALRAGGFAAAFLIAFGLGTLSEPFALVSGLLAAGVGLLALPRLKLAQTWRPFTWCALWCSGLACGLIVLYTSPGARWRRAQQPDRESVLSAGELRGTFEDWLHMWDAVTGQWAYLGAAAVGVLLGWGAGLRARAPGSRGWKGRRSAPRNMLIAVLLLPVPVVVLGSFAVVLGLRSGYGPSGWTYARTWTNYLVPMELALCAYGALLGEWAGRFLARRGASALVVSAGIVAAGGLALAALAVLVPSVQQLTTATVTRAAAWDAQNSRIRSQAAQGAADVGYRPLYVGSLAEPFYTSDYTRDWVAACVSKWYGIDRIHRL
ncbi:hypothetical protein [Streptomyces sp. NBC_01296]|uniref:hypothetical protein n=1 Tax=Streptomyces sp. NBC_01296 TaxID=2903816 RepID=UPI002E15D514|nr:DUF6056 family protein [Streptomyces sp. NBC_01296]